MKYHHTNITQSNVDWDSVLIKSLDGIKKAPDLPSFQDSLQTMVDQSGALQSYIDYWVNRGDSLQVNRNFSWHSHSIYPPRTRILLDSIRSRFKNEAEKYISMGKNSPYFMSDKKYSDIDDFPEENYRILAVFRYWNLVNYFYYFHSMNIKKWDDAMKDQLTLILNSNNKEEYHLNFKKITKMIQDSKGKMNSPVYDSILGEYYAPFLLRYIENKTIITQKIPSKTLGIDIGDEIEEYNGIPIEQYRNYWRQYAEGSNNETVERNVNELIVRGEMGKFSLKVRKADNTYFIFQGRRDSFNYDSLYYETYDSKPWRDTVLADGCRFGIVQMNLFHPMYSRMYMWEDLWNTDAIIFDMRGKALFPFDDTFFSQHVYGDYTYFYYYKKPKMEIPGEFYSSKTYNMVLNKPVYGQNFILLVDEKTHSNAENFAISFQAHSKVIRIGGQTEGSGGTVCYVSLPGSIVTTFTLNGAVDKNGIPYHKNGVPRDYLIKETVLGIRNGRDEVLDFALNCKFSYKKFSSLISNDFHTVEVFPNPVVNTLYLKDKESQFKSVTIYDIMQRKIYDGTFKNQLEVDFSKFENGMYFIKIGEETIRIIKNR